MFSHSFFSSFGADARRQSGLQTPLPGPPAPGLASTSVGEGLHHHVRLGFRPPERETLALNRVLMFALVVAAGAIACAGTILALFAWTGARL